MAAASHHTSKHHNVKQQNTEIHQLEILVSNKVHNNEISVAEIQ